MNDKIIYLYPRNCSYTTQKEVYMRFYLAYQNTTGAQKRAHLDALRYLIVYWSITHKCQTAWAMYADSGAGSM